MIRHLLLFFFTIITSYSYSQSTVEDSLINVSRVQKFNQIFQNGDTKGAQQYALNLADSLSKSDDEFYTAYWEGIVGYSYFYGVNPDFNLSLEHYQKALNFFTKYYWSNPEKNKKVILTIANNYMNLSSSYGNLNQIGNALFFLDSAYYYYTIDPSVRKKAVQNIYNVYSNKGAYAFAIGEYKRGILNCAEAISFLDSLDASTIQPAWYADAYVNMGQCYSALEDSTNAFLCFKEAKSRVDKISTGDTYLSNLAGIYDGIGQTYDRFHEFEKSFDAFNTGFQKLEKINPYSYQTSFLEFQTGKAYRALDSIEKAAEIIQRAIGRLTKSGYGNASFIAEYWRQLGETFGINHQWDKALSSIDSAQNLLQDTSLLSPEGVFWQNIYLTKASIYYLRYKSTMRKPEDLNMAYENLNKSQYWLDIRHQALSDFSPIYLQNVQDQTNMTLSVLLEMYRVKKEKYLIDKLFSLVDRGKSLHQLEQFRYSSNFVNRTLNESEKRLLAQENKFNLQIGALESELLKEKKEEDRIACLNKIKKAQELLDNLRSQEKDKKTQTFKYTSVQDVQSKLPDDQSIVEYVIADSIYIFVINKYKVFEPVVVEKNKEFNKWINDLSKILSDSTLKQDYREPEYILNISSKFAETANNLYQQLIRPVQKNLKRRIIFVRDKELNFLPFEVLVTSLPGKQVFFNELSYLINTYDISYQNSVSLFCEIKKYREKPSQDIIYIAPFADKTESQNLLIGYLPASGTWISKMCPLDNPCGTLFNNDAQKIVILDTIQYYKIIHFFTHGYADSKNGKESRLAVRGGKNGDLLDFVFASEIFHTHLNAELVVFEACETANGKLQRGEGLISLSNAFLSAGAKSALATQWEIETSIAGNEICDSFYHYIFDKNLKLNRDEALSGAKRDYIRKRNGTAGKIYECIPYFWAPFILIGESGKI